MRDMSSTMVQCAKCGSYVQYSKWKGHECGKTEERAADFGRMTHKQVIEHYSLRPGEIEEGMAFLFSELPIYRGRADMITRDSKMGICIVEVAHRSNYSHGHWVKKLRTYRSHLRRIGGLIFGVDDFEVRMLLVKPGRSVEEVTT